MGFSSTLSDVSWVSYNSTQLNTICLETAPDITGSGLSLSLTQGSRVDRTEVLTIPSFGSVDFSWFAQEAHKIQKTISLTRYWFIIRKYNSGTANQKRCMEKGKVWRKGAEIPCPLRSCHSPPISMRSPTWKLSKPSFLGVYGGLITYHNWLNHWPLMTDLTSSPCLLPRGHSVVLKIPTL